MKKPFKFFLLINCWRANIAKKFRFQSIKDRPNFWTFAKNFKQDKLWKITFLSDLKKFLIFNF